MNLTIKEYETSKDLFSTYKSKDSKKDFKKFFINPLRVFQTEIKRLGL